MTAAVSNPGLPSQAEFHEAIALRGDRWYSACLRITRSPEMAEDAMQDALLNAWNKRDQFDRGARLDTWIHRIAINAALQILRKNKPERYEALEEEPEGNLPTPEYLHAEEELGNELSTALAKLSNIERISFVLKHLEQWRLKEIAAELDTTVGTIKQALFRAVKKLRVSMSDLRSAS